MIQYEATHGVAPGVAPQGTNLGGLPQERSKKIVLIVQLPKLSNWASAPHGESFGFHGNFVLKLKKMTQI